MKLSKKTKFDVAKVTFGKELDLNNIADLLYCFSDAFFTAFENATVLPEFNKIIKDSYMQKNIIGICKLLSDKELQEVDKILNQRLMIRNKNFKEEILHAQFFRAKTSLFDVKKYQYVINIICDEKQLRVDREFEENKKTY